MNPLELVAAEVFTIDRTYPKLYIVCKACVGKGLVDREVSVFMLYVLTYKRYLYGLGQPPDFFDQSFPRADVGSGEGKV